MSGPPAGITLGRHTAEAAHNVHAEGYWEAQFRWLTARGIIR